VPSRSAPRSRPRPRPRFAVLAAAAVTAATAAGLLAAAAPASAQSAVNYVALGDSYASGLGAGNYGSSGSCDQSSGAFSQLWSNANHPASFTQEACSGATTGSVISSQLGPLNSSTTLVSLIVGGNDVGFSNTMETCVLDSTSTCVSAVDADEQLVATQLPGELNSVLGDIRADAPNAHVVVLDYPQFYDLSQSAYCIGLSTTDRQALNGGAADLDSAIQAAAARYGDSFVDVQSYFSGHQICDSNSYLHSVNWLDLGESYHPTASGQADAYLPAFTSAAG
jgi:lysophospholipase L1-like esterase